MNFECLLLSAKAGNEDAITTILQMYRPLLLKYAIPLRLIWLLAMLQTAQTPK